MHDAVRGAGNRFDPVCCSSLQYVPLYGTLWGMAVVSDQADPLLLTADAVDARLAQHGIGPLKLYNSATRHALLSLPPFVQALLQQDARPIEVGEELLPHTAQPYRLVAA